MSPHFFQPPLYFSQVPFPTRLLEQVVCTLPLTPRRSYSPLSPRESPTLTPTVLAQTIDSVHVSNLMDTSQASSELILRGSGVVYKWTLFWNTPPIFLLRRYTLLVPLYLPGFSYPHMFASSSPPTKPWILECPRSQPFALWAHPFIPSPLFSFSVIGT